MHLLLPPKKKPTWNAYFTYKGLVGVNSGPKLRASENPVRHTRSPEPSPPNKHDYWPSTGIYRLPVLLHQISLTYVPSSSQLRNHENMTLSLSLFVGILVCLAADFLIIEAKIFMPHNCGDANISYKIVFIPWCLCICLYHELEGIEAVWEGLVVLLSLGHKGMRMLYRDYTGKPGGSWTQSAV